jgi:hypothetical protein
LWHEATWEAPIKWLAGPENVISRDNVYGGELCARLRIDDLLSPGAVLAATRSGRVAEIAALRFKFDRVCRL